MNETPPRNTARDGALALLALVFVALLASLFVPNVSCGYGPRVEKTRADLDHYARAIAALPGPDAAALADLDPSMRAWLRQPEDSFGWPVEVAIGERAVILTSPGPDGILGSDDDILARAER